MCMVNRKENDQRVSGNRVEGSITSIQDSKFKDPLFYGKVSSVNIIWDFK